MVTIPPTEVAVAVGGTGVRVRVAVGPVGVLVGDPTGVGVVPTMLARWAL